MSALAGSLSQTRNTDLKGLHAWDEGKRTKNRDLTPEQYLDKDMGLIDIHLFSSDYQVHGPQHTEIQREQDQLMGNKSSTVLITNLTRDGISLKIPVKAHTSMLRNNVSIKHIQN